MPRKPEVVCSLLCLGVVVAISYILVRRTLYVESANASLQGYAIALSSDVEGEVLRVLVDENQHVRKGQLLCILEDRLWVARLQEAQAKYDQLRFQWEGASKDGSRAAFLFRKRAISAQSNEAAGAKAEALFSQMKAAQANVAEALTHYQRTRISAPSDGVIAFRTARPGMFAEPGFPLFGFVDEKDRWVLAKVRETDLPNLHLGKSVQVQFDAVPGRRFVGKIESIGPSTERYFYSGVPADFSAGNFTKYVQWYPIRIHLALNATDQARMPIGISSHIHMSRD